MQDCHRERLERLALIIERQPHTKIEDPVGFNMRDWTHSCGTPACIWGWAEFVRTEGRADLKTVRIRDTADWLGVGEHWDDLFCPSVSRGIESITPHQAAEALRKLAATGCIDWTHVDPLWASAEEE